MSELERLMPDPDRRDGALERLLVKVAEPEPVLRPSDVRILQALSHGLTEAEAAVAFGWSKDSVHDSVRHVRRVLGAKTIAHAVAEALRQRIIV